MIFPQGVYGQLYGGIAQGLGYALMEQVTYAEAFSRRPTSSRP